MQILEFRKDFGQDSLHTLIGNGKNVSLESIQKSQLELLQKYKFCTGEQRLFIDRLEKIVEFGCIIESAEIGHIAGENQFAHSYISVIALRKHVGKILDDAEESEEVIVYGCDMEHENKFWEAIPKDLSLDQLAHFYKIQRKGKIVCKDTSVEPGYINFMFLKFPYDAFERLDLPLQEKIKSEYACIQVMFYAPGPKNSWTCLFLAKSLGLDL
jgi:hypothetical protein